MTIVDAALVGLATSAILAPLILTGLRHAGVLDHPNDRSSHSTPVPRGGGMAVGVGAIVAICLASGLPLHIRLSLALPAGGLGLVGAAEDLRGIPPLSRLALQALVATVALPALLVGLRGPLAWQVVFAGGVVVWMAAYANAFNFMDGINGISAAQAVVAGVSYWWLGRITHVPGVEAGGLIVAAATAGFGPWNTPRARMFLGDVGSYLLGGWLAALVVVALRAGITPVAALAPVAIYMADTAITLLRRAARGEVWYQAHRSHAYQRLVQAGWSHGQATAVVAGAIAACAVLGRMALGRSVGDQAGLGLAIVVVLGGYLLLPELMSRHARGAQALTG